MPVAFAAIAQADSNKARSTVKPAQKPPAGATQVSPLKQNIPLKKTIDTVVRKAPRAAVTSARRDGIKVRDSINTAHGDSLKKAARNSVLSAINGQGELADTIYNKFFDVPYLPVKAAPAVRIDAIRESVSKDVLFYVLAGIFFFLGFVRLFFPKYFVNLFRMIMQTSFRQKQTREQLLQDRLPSLLMNIFFVLVGGVFIALAATRNNWLATVEFWVILLYCSGLLACIYLVKFLVLKFTGWVFNAPEAAGIYAFIVFLINKMLGVALLPLLLLYAFSSDGVNNILITIIASLVVFTYGYRYIVSLSTIRGNLKVNAIHFFIYLCAVEIVPMIIIYKVLFNYVSKNI